MTVQVEISGKTLESYEKNRDKFISKLEKMGCDVIVEDDGEDEEE
jgi:ABC-type xylose transport system substrate-binding protein